MLGAIIGDIVGSIYELNNIHTKDFRNFFSPRGFYTDDTVMTLAVADTLLRARGRYKHLDKRATATLRRFGRRYPYETYSQTFKMWLFSSAPKPYNSCGNGAAMRISPVAYFARSEEEVKSLAYKVTAISHNHPEGIKGAEATAMAIYLALHKKSKDEIKEYIEKNYYSLDFDYETLKNTYQFDETCQGTVPQAIYCFLISDSFEDAVRTGISIGGDSDTIGAITGAIAEAYYGISPEFKEDAYNYLDRRMTKICKRFEKYTQKANRK